MAVHKSLRPSKGAASNRSVLKRAERLEQLSREGRWKPGDRVVGIPKTRVLRAKVKVKAAKKKDDAAAPAAAAAAPAKKK
ncbi:MAG: small basic protein [Planctomycetes bacterium]|nr:small basic protein [Planctomycetota bacterium]